MVLVVVGSRRISAWREGYFSAFLGIRTLSQYTRLPAAGVLARFGQAGRRMLVFAGASEASDPASDSISLDSDKEMPPLALQVSVPAGHGEIAWIIKVFATRGTTRFRWLETLALDHPMQRIIASRKSVR